MRQGFSELTRMSLLLILEVSVPLLLMPSCPYGLAIYLGGIFLAILEFVRYTFSNDSGSDFDIYSQCLWTTGSQICACGYQYKAKICPIVQRCFA